MRPIEDWADLKFRPGGHLAHVVAFGDTKTLCGLIEDGTMHGTGDFDEIVEARALPVCGFCLQSSTPDPAVQIWTEATAEHPIDASDLP